MSVLLLSRQRLSQRRLSQRRPASSDKWRPIFRIDLADLFLPIDVRLVNGFDTSAAAVVAAGTEFAFRAAGIP